MNENPATLLLVDDEPFDIDILLEYLEDSPYTLDIAEDGLTAWEKLEADPERFDVVILDRMMPGLSGLEVLERIKQHDILQSVPVILQTPLAARVEVLEGLQAGAYYYLTKPFDGAMLRSVLATAVEDHRRYRQAQEDSRAVGRTFGLLLEATFAFRDLQEARDLAVLLANACPEPKRVAVGLTELLLNAVEHGNLGISYQEKSRLREAERWDEEINRRLADPVYAAREVRVTYRREPTAICMVIEDQGDGFDFARYLDMDPVRAFDTHGRGIAMSRMLSFDVVEYHGCGNRVAVRVDTTSR